MSSACDRLASPVGIIRNSRKFLGVIYIDLFSRQTVDMKQK